MLSLTYNRLPDSFYKFIPPTPVANPQLVIFNEALAGELGLSASKIPPEQWAGWLSGNEPVPGSQPLAMAYAGHQFGGFNILGDGRALLLGELVTPGGDRVDMHLKGSGPTPYARRGDGRATLHAMLREYIMSECMHHLHVPCSRSLAVVSTGERVLRNGPEQGGILCRIARSHIRTGTFEYAAHATGKAGLQALLNYTLNRHFPELEGSEHPALSLLEKVMERQISLVMHWMRVGFIHGVMNTDNVSIPGETIDFGPCAFMDAYDPKTVFSFIDTHGRYAFGAQPNITHWNMACLAGALLPLMHEDEKKAVAMAQECVSTYPEACLHAYRDMMNAKLGMETYRTGDEGLVQELLGWMQAAGADYTLTFRDLSQVVLPEEELYRQPVFEGWYHRWQERLRLNDVPAEERSKKMRETNPALIARNHLVEHCLTAATEGDMKPLEVLCAQLTHAYTDPTGVARAHLPSPSSGQGYFTHCNT